MKHDSFDAAIVASLDTQRALALREYQHMINRCATAQAKCQSVITLWQEIGIAVIDYNDERELHELTGGNAALIQYSG